MLILSRRAGDSILIGDGVRVRVLECDRRGVRIGIEAPADVSILRGEIVEQIADENLRASAATEGRDWLDVIRPRSTHQASEGGDPSAEASARKPG